MLDNWYETMETSKMRYETMINDMQILRRNRWKHGADIHHSALSIYVLGGLGKAFSTIGDSLQSHYHFGDGNDNRRHMKKVS